MRNDVLTGDTYRLSRIAYRISHIAYRLSLIAYRPLPRPPKPPRLGQKTTPTTNL